MSNRVNYKSPPGPALRIVGTGARWASVRTLEGRTWFALAEVCLVEVVGEECRIGMRTMDEVRFPCGGVDLAPLLDALHGGDGLGTAQGRA